MLSGRFASTFTGRSFFARYATRISSSPRFWASAASAPSRWHGHMYFGRKQRLRAGLRRVAARARHPLRSRDRQPRDERQDDRARHRAPRRQREHRKQFFAWAHYMDPHDQYSSTRRPRISARKRATATTRKSGSPTSGVGKLLDWAQNAALVEGHGRHRHRRSRRSVRRARDVQPRVRALGGARARAAVRYAPGAKARRIEERRSHIDLAPTILELMGVEISARGCSGQEPGPRALRRAPDDREPILCELADDSHNPPRRAHHQRPLQAHRLRPRPLRALRSRRRSGRNARPRERPTPPNFHR